MKLVSIVSECLEDPKVSEEETSIRETESVKLQPTDGDLICYCFELLCLYSCTGYSGPQILSRHNPIVSYKPCLF